MEWLNNLNPAQREAVLHRDGPCLVLAGAGSGKTRVLTSRLANLVNEGVRPSNILAITFTNKAAQEMRERVLRLMPNFGGEWIQTFHAASYRILRRDIQHLGYRPDFTILDDGDQKVLVKEVLKERSGYEVKPEEVLSMIHRAKNSLQDPDNYFRELKIPMHKVDIYLKAYHGYQARLKELNALDFEDLINLTIRLFTEHPDVLDAYRQRFRYVMIDEYQDTNRAQYIWANLLAQESGNLFVVGDPDQSIYSWRGAEPENIRRFLSDYPGAKVVKLEENYRSSGHILQAANAV
ncbi:MAG: ATP-dependent helicase, partial [Methylocystaceae bacterium]